MDEQHDGRVNMQKKSIKAIKFEQHISNRHLIITLQGEESGIPKLYFKEGLVVHWIL